MCEKLYLEKCELQLFSKTLLKMLPLLSKCIKDASVLRRLEFAASFYPRSMPNYWENLASFSLKEKEDRNTLTSDLAHQFIENMEVLDKETFSSDIQLNKEIMTMKRQGSDTPIGVVLISTNDKCCKCASSLYIRADRPSTVTVYDDALGTLPGTHYTKYCRRGGCSFQQHYGYYTIGDSSEVTYDQEWSVQEYFLATRETAISMDMLHRLDKELLIGQLSYKQRADIYNDVHGYCCRRQMEGARLG